MGVPGPLHRYFPPMRLALGPGGWEGGVQMYYLYPPALIGRESNPGPSGAQANARTIQSGWPGLLPIPLALYICGFNYRGWN